MPMRSWPMQAPPGRSRRCFKETEAAVGTTAALGNARSRSRRCFKETEAGSW